MDNRQHHNSREIFINAAGRLFAERGTVDVSIRDIASEAGIDSSMIKYHFGSKDGLIKSVVATAVRPWQANDLSEYFRDNEGLLESRDGQIIFVTEMVELIHKRFNSGDEESWCKGFILQFIQRSSPLRQEIIDTYMKPSVMAFYEAYRRISGNDDFESAFCWYLFILCPIYMLSGANDMISLFHPEGKMTASFQRRMLLFCTQQILAGFKL